MPTSQGRNAKGELRDVAVGSQNEQIFGSQYGAWYGQTAAGNVYSMTTIPAGLAIPIETTVTPLVMLWNPSDSGKNAVLINFTLTQNSGTAIVGSVGLVLRTNTGSTAATGANVAAFANNVYNTNTFGGLLGGPNRSVVRASSQGTNTIVAGVFAYPLFHIGALVTTTQIIPPQVIKYEFNGELVLAPGNAVFVGGSAAQTALFNQSISWAEVPV